MANLNNMPEITFYTEEIKRWGDIWLGDKDSKGNTKLDSRFDKKQSMDFGKEFIDKTIAEAISKMLGDIPIVSPVNKNVLLPPINDCVEVGDSRVVGGIRTQNFDIIYRPDGVRIAYDSKTLNDTSSVKKNWNNMINDLAAEATTVHIRFPYALVLFVVVIPKPALKDSQAIDIIRTLERLNTRDTVRGENSLAESISLIVWDPDTGNIDSTVPDSTSNLRVEKFSKRVYKLYTERYAGLPPHSR